MQKDSFETLVEALRGWSRSALYSESKLVMFLDHEYTESSLRYRGLAALKGDDRDIVCNLEIANTVLPPELRINFYIAKGVRRKVSYGNEDPFTGHVSWTEPEEQVRFEKWFAEDGQPFPAGDKVLNSSQCIMSALTSTLTAMTDVLIYVLQMLRRLTRLLMTSLDEINDWSF